MTTETKGEIARIQNWKQNPDKSVRGLPNFARAQSLRAGLTASPKTDERVRVRRRPDGTYDVLIFDRVAPTKAATK